MVELSKVFEEVVQKILLSLDTDKAAGVDKIPAKILKDGVDELSLSLKNTTNLLIKLSSFPKECTIAKLKYELNNLFCFCR